MINWQKNPWEELGRRGGFRVEGRRDDKGVASGWCTIRNPELLLTMAAGVAVELGRLSMVTAYLSEKAKGEGIREIAYHFDLDGATLTVTAELPLKGAKVPSLAGIFRNADWHERELMELYDVEVIGHPDPRPLFLDRSADPPLFEGLIPYSAFTSGAGTKTLWEKVMAAREGK